MRFINLAGRMTLVDPDGRGIDVERASGGRLPSDPAAALDRWEEVAGWAAGHHAAGDVEIDDALIGPPSPAPRQILGVGLNYASHAAESGFELPEHPVIFVKLHASLAGPFDDIPISTGAVDWEVELAVVIGRRARRVAAADALEHVAGYTVAQDLSEREIQFRPANIPQFSLGKSLPRFGPIGPALVTLDELDHPDDLELTCTVNGVEKQRGRTSDFIFGVPELIEYLSAVTVLHPGDVIMTGTPSGVGSSRTPAEYLQPGDVLVSGIEQIGSMRHAIVRDGERARRRDQMATNADAASAVRATGEDGVPNPVMHHINLKTTRLGEMTDWYGEVCGMRPNFASEVIAFLTNDAANHRLALLAVPGLSEDPDKLAHTGMHHSAFEFDTVGHLLTRYETLKAKGIVPHACLDHGLTTSFYYEDPDGNSVELQADNFGDWAASTEWVRTAPEFVANPIGVYVDPDRMVEAHRSGMSAGELHRRGYAGEFAPAAPQDLHLP